ncbi:Uncharacterised protein [Elizabethkingia miricola]|uniref:Uncharacterized protein n=1 Tax=Elizabethkingia miricola TaxID=172045 RepID=A0ABD4DQY5_ELIMR|nr:hypothetical protein [Elizabethkingia miricola]DAT28662.1 MAG TPA: hypothetical protein [Caudoviricetes sp.]KUY20920.1 hypothetical protein ATB95_08460 [Elizabethkingia miricola]MCL1654216.1 hypothetical protein [Elizabethkingia miricola]SPW34303.1 Uncharacterised protein [Elizabethkingia miricola]DAU38066.1 MAG TPA: hypothetical protein [Caudoviricetes sp.]
MKEVIKLAVERGICKEWRNKMSKASIEDYCKMFFKGSDWAMEKDFPSLGLLRKYKTTSHYGLYTDAKAKKKNAKQIAFFGESNSELEYDEHHIGEIYIRHKSNIKIIAKDYCFLIITIADGATVEIEAEENTKVTVFQYGGTVKGNAIIHQRSWEK